MRIFPFAALRPASGREAEIASVPYDVVSAAEARRLAADNPNSFLHVVRSEIDLPEGTDPYDDAVYQRARIALDRLIHEELLIHDESPRMYLYAQRWRDQFQVGLVCCAHVDDYEHNVIKKHEKTRQVKEDDRTRHVIETNANTGPVFLTYRDTQPLNDRIESDIKATPLYQFTTPDDVEHIVWPVDNWSPYETLMESVPCAYVADGHHRSASAWRAGKQKRADNPEHHGDEEYNRFLVVLFSAKQLLILPYNRIVRDLNGLSSEQLCEKLEEIGTLKETNDPQPTEPGTFGVILDTKSYIFSINPTLVDRNDPIRSLDVAVLQDHILHGILGIGDPRTDERIDFVGGIRGPEYLELLVKERRAAAAFVLYPTSIEQLMHVSNEGLVMPPKSTWFEPKLRSGLLLHTLD